MSFRDHFSSHSSSYSEFRPGYPKELFSYLKTLVPDGTSVWDCGTGNGQAAVSLAEVFDSVIATDPSANQISEAEEHPKVRYLVASAENSTLENLQVDLVTVAQAFHWFDFDAFFTEVRRVCKPGGVLAIWGYGLQTTSPETDTIVKRLYGEITGPYWPPERRYVEEAYKTVPFPFSEIDPPALFMEEFWTVEQVLGYLRTWSSVQKFIQKNGRDPVSEVEDQLRSSWGNSKLRSVKWPLFFRIGRIL
ncbi:class I SAM-dependent methyltransferase [Leptospira gomenensis]|uniref:Class I SAM-dependent methyltransferase n=2 Tax=Leptospira gomenensis TaxID=2484974 RepID=A0A5F1Y5S6_9LEPT|nr:class I SAM-dependent methyltransferase [Leptospira gomenensis]TGK38223.1 class I SAM-dependent methyltransferase [Leptospira gomenensis]TGK42647.1 class I SAM-dependent methyltransferase [Leptospira gomenensis]TGK65810.1 class I SAM-dependent methyltransferase [Leptospira gomenensis]